MKNEEWKNLRKLATMVDKTLSQPLKVCERQCDQCLFSKGKIVPGERAREILAECEKEQTHFICHKGTIARVDIVCNGFFQNKTTPYLELAKAAGRIDFVNPDTLGKQKNVKGNNIKKQSKNKRRRT